MCNKKSQANSHTRSLATPRHNWPCKGLSCLGRGYLSQSSRLGGVLEALKHKFPPFSIVLEHSVPRKGSYAPRVSTEVRRGRPRLGITHTFFFKRKCRQNCRILLFLVAVGFFFKFSILRKNLAKTLRELCIVPSRSAALLISWVASQLRPKMFLLKPARVYAII